MVRYASLTDLESCSLQALFFSFMRTQSKNLIPSLSATSACTDFSLSWRDQLWS